MFALAGNCHSDVVVRCRRDQCFLVVILISELESPRLTAGIIGPETTVGPRVPEVDLGCTGFRAKIERGSRGGQLDIKNRSERLYCAFRRDTNTKNATALEKERATAKPNARRMANGGARESEMSRTLARDGSWKERRA